MLIAPVTLGDGARTGAGSVVNRDVEAGQLVVGVPARPIRRARTPKPESRDEDVVEPMTGRCRPDRSLTARAADVERDA